MNEEFLMAPQQQTSTERSGAAPTRRSSRRWMMLAVVAAVLIVSGAVLFGTEPGRKTQFILGGALVNLGYRMQDHLKSYDFESAEEVAPEDIWNELQKQNSLAAAVRQRFPRTARHPLVAMVVCMDARLDTNELTGDTRRYYYFIRTAGSVLSEREQEMLELAVENGVKLIVLTTHSDCAAERVASQPETRERYPALSHAVDEREARFRELLARPAIASRIAEGKLLVKLINIDTMTEKMLPHPKAPAH
jgi:carbonic anhydrase